MISISIVTVIGLGLYALVLFLQWWAKANDNKAKKVAEIDKEIDSANDADDLMRVAGKLRNKK
jgi:hypothetical protein